MNHVAPNSDAIIQNPGNFLGTGTTYIAPPGSQDTTANPFYYGRSSDPIYVVNSCTNADGDPYNPVGTFWHIPNQAQFSGLNGDCAAGMKNNRDNCNSSNAACAASKCPKCTGSNDPPNNPIRSTKLE